MSRRTLFAAAVLATSACALYGCSSSDDKGTGSSTSPTSPGASSSSGGASSSGSSGASSSGASSSGASSSGSSGASSSGASSSGASSSGSSGKPDGGSGANCVPKGYAGNDKKIGAYCDKDTPCPFQLDPFLICTYGHTDEPDLLFCTAPCSKDSECGSGAYCMKDTGGSGCVPAACGGKPTP